MEASHNEVGAEGIPSSPTRETSTKICSQTVIKHPLQRAWTLYAHLPHDTDWSVKSYKNLMTVSSVEEAAKLYATLPPDMVKNCMLFLMRDGVKPTWEDPLNRAGGCFSHKISNKGVDSAWKLTSYMLMGGTLSESASVLDKVNGITISPKKNFCILKIWMSGCDLQDPGVFTDVPGVPKHGCIFKRHAPQL